MKKVILFICTLFFTCSTFGNSINLNQIVFFGDSLSDDGNLFHLLFRIAPKSPPYFNGRFSNGPVWSEYVGKYFYERYYIGYKVYALGGATALFHLPSLRFITTSTIDLQINYYLLDGLFKDKSRALFSIWIGGNDYLFDEYSNAEQLTSDVVSRTKWAITTLIERGAKYFLVLNLPDLSILPFSRIHGTGGRLRLLTLLHNQKLATEVSALRAAYPDVKFVYGDMYAAFQSFIKNPDAFNKKYHVHITNLDEACWGGGYLFAPYTDEQINDEIRGALTEESDASIFDINAIRDFIVNSPDISQSLLVGGLFDKGMRPCRHPDQHIFWDQIHPTHVVNKIISKIVVSELKKNLRFGQMS